MDSSDLAAVTAAATSSQTTARNEWQTKTLADGTTHIVMSPLEFMQRLAAPVNPTTAAAPDPLP